MEKIRTIFAGTPDFALPSLKLLKTREDVELVSVYTQPDRPAGRGRKIQESNVKREAKGLGLPLLQPASLRNSEYLLEFRQQRPKLLIVVAYGLLIPKEILSVPDYCINVHASLLPKWRGAAPIQRAIMQGDKKTGVSIMRIVEELDAGPIWTLRECEISNTDTTETLSRKLSEIGAFALDTAITMIQNNSIREVDQRHLQTSYAKKINGSDQVIDWSKTAWELNCQIRALSPKPGAITNFGATRVKILASETTLEKSGNLPGSVIKGEKDILQIATGSTDLRIITVQPLGKKIMAIRDFLNGYRSLF